MTLELGAGHIISYSYFSILVVMFMLEKYINIE